jgi:Na+-translocating ferredoxin:NAD+ oxidoreductase subunit B
LFEDYFVQAFGKMLSVQPAVHRVIPVKEAVQVGLEIRPYESAAELVASAQAWGVLDCICRKQKLLLGDPCEHPIRSCLAFSSRPGAFDQSPVVQALTQAEALQTLRMAAEAGLVHSVSNNQRDITYVCNCCTCSCGVLRGMAEFGVANVVAKSAFVCQVDGEFCLLCGDCLDRCQFDAIQMNEELVIDQLRCAGCGVCAISCEQGALSLVYRQESEIPLPPVTEMEWKRERAQARHLSLDDVL